MNLRYSFVDGRLVITTEVSAPIAARTLARHRLLHAVLDDERTLEERLADLGKDCSPESELDWIAHPAWEDYDDLRFAQVLMNEAMDGFAGPWGDDLDISDADAVSSKEEFLDGVREWANCNEPCPDEEMADWLRAAEAAMRLDVEDLLRIVKPYWRSWRGE